MSSFKPNYFQRRSKPQGPKANERIRALDVQVIGSDGNNLGTYTADSSCGSSTHLFGSFQPTSPVVISNQTQGMEVNFSITGRGMQVFPDGSGGMSGFGGGPFSPSL